MAKASKARDIDEIAAGLPRRIHEIAIPQGAAAADHIALVEDGSSWTYRDLDLRTAEIATALSSLGVRAGDRLIVVSDNCISLVGLLLAASRLDAWAIVVNPRSSARELEQIRDHSGARRMFFTSNASEEAASHASRYGAENLQLDSLRGTSVGPLNESAAVEPVEIDSAKQVAVLSYTSGTAGAPKAVMLSHENLLISAKTVAHFRRMNRNDKTYLLLPISNIVGLSLLIMTLTVGGTVRLVTQYNPASLAKAIADEGVTMLEGLPGSYQRLLEYKAVSGLKRLARGSLRLTAVSGAALDLNLKSRVEKEFDLPLLNTYGITECSPGISAVHWDVPQCDHSVGMLLPGVEARVRTLDGIPLARGEVGELHVRGRNVTRGYYRTPELTARAIDSEGWLNTGDLGRFDGDRLYIVGPTKQMTAVYPAQLEAVLNSHKDVVRTTVVAPAADGNEEVVAFVQPRARSRLKPADLMDFIRPRLASYNSPPIIIVLDASPATSTYKIPRRESAASIHNGATKTPHTRYRSEDGPL